MNGTPNSYRKMEGCGNSFVLMGISPDQLPAWRARAERICSKEWGIGSDGLLLVLPSQSHDFRVAMFNPDGSPMGMCGNGIRCVARFVVLEGMWPSNSPELRFDVEGREILCRLEAGERVRVDMGEPILEGARIPTAVSGPVIQQKLEVPGAGPFLVDAVSMGNPHCVIEVDRVAVDQCLSLGPQIERHPFFPERVNVEFVQVHGPGDVSMEVWERGAGRTLACGTGMCAAVVALARRGRVERSARVRTAGGTVMVDWDERTNRVFLTGPAADVASGVFSSEFLTERIEEGRAWAA